VNTDSENTDSENTDSENTDSTRGAAARPASQPTPPSPQAPKNLKTSYEGSANVQRWLEEHALPESEAGAEGRAFHPTFLAHQRDRLWVLSSLAHFYEEDLISDVLHVVKSGKEATVYCCRAHPATGAEYLAAKVYRPRMFRSLRNDAVYRQSRAQRDERGREVRGRRRLPDPKSARGRASQISAWIGYEYETQRRLYDAGADVPRPISQTGNAVLMEYIGDEDGTAAPLLREVELTREEAAPLFERILRNIELWLACDRIHGDLSAYNVLYWQGAVTIIDFAQAVDPRYSADVYPLLARDVARICAYFARYGVAADPSDLASDLWQRYLRGEL
jgi:RIO kinase 1